MNESAIGRLVEFQDMVLNTVKNRDMVSCTLQNLDFDSALYSFSIDGTPVAETAIDTIMSALRVRNNFLSYKYSMEREKWEVIKKALKDANRNKIFLGNKVTAQDGSSEITKLFQKNESWTSDNMLTFQDYFDMIIGALAEAKRALTIKPKFLQNKEIVSIDFLENARIDVFNDSMDFWSKGSNIQFDLLQYSSAPFVERLICANGAVATKYGFRTNLQNKSYNKRVILADIKKQIGIPNNWIAGMLVGAVKHLRNYDISLREFLKARSFFSRRNNKDKDQYGHILKTVFDMGDIIDHYGNISDRSTKWLSTATSGRNAYDFFNDLTWISSHADKSRIDELDALELQTTTAELLFKESLDLEDVAPRVCFHVGKTFRNNN